MRERLAGSCAFRIKWFICPSTPNTTPSSIPSNFLLREPNTRCAWLLICFAVSSSGGNHTLLALHQNYTQFNKFCCCERSISGGMHVCTSVKGVQMLIRASIALNLKFDVTFRYSKIRFSFYFYVFFVSHDEIICFSSAFFGPEKFIRRKNISLAEAFSFLGCSQYNSCLFLDTSSHFWEP